MKPQLSRFGTLTVAAALALALGSPAVVNAQRSRGTGGAGDDGGGRSGGGDRGVAIPRGDAGPRGGDAGPRGGDAGTRGGDAGARGGDQGGGRVSAGGTSSPRTTAETQDTTGDRAVPRRPREDRRPVGRAMPRADVPRSNGAVIVGGGRYYGGYYPWGYGGLGLGGYYGFYDPFWTDPYYGGYYGNYYGNYYGGNYYGGRGYYEGRLRLKVKPSDAEVFVDGYYAGIVDEFDNVFQHLNIETGPHRIEIREDGYEPLTFEVRVLPGRTVTYKGELKRNP